MRKISEYIEEIEDGLILEKGFWDKLKSFFGFDSKKLSQSMSNWSDNEKIGYTSSQYIAAKSKDKDIRKAAQNQAKAATINKKELLKTVKDEVERLDLVLKQIKYPDHCLKQYQLLKTLSNEEGDVDGQKQAHRFKKRLDARFGDEIDKAEENIDKIETTMEKNNIDNGPKDDTITDNGELKDQVTDEIKDNNDMLRPLAKKAGIDGNTLLNFVVTQLSSLKSNATRTKSNKEKAKKELGDDVILGTSIMICGAIITKDAEKLKIICDHIQTSTDDLLKKVQKHKSKSKE